MYISQEEQERLAEELFEKYLDPQKGNEVFFGKGLAALYEKYDEFTADGIVRRFKEKVKVHYQKIEAKQIFTYRPLYEEVIKKGKLAEHFAQHAEKIYRHGSHELIQCQNGEDYVWINLDVESDLQTPIFHVKKNADTLDSFCHFAEAFECFQQTIKGL